ETIRNPTVFGLEIANRAASPEPKQTVRLTHIVPVTHQQLLKFQALHTRQHTLIPRPILQEGAAASQTVSEVPDCQRIGLGRVVFHDDAEVVEHQEARSPNARWYQQESLFVGSRERLPVGAPDSLPFPFAKAHRA